MRFGSGPVARWELALVPGQDPTTLGRGSTFGYGVDSGTGCFADGGLFARIRGDRRIAEEMTDQLERSPLGFIHHASADADLFGFTSGFGDGTYPSWFGLDEHGAAVCLVTDFGFGTFARPVANPDPARFGAAIARRVDELVRAAGEPTWTEEHVEAARELEGCAEVGDHLATVLEAITAATPAELVRLAWVHAAAPAGQAAFAAWLRDVTPARAVQVLDVEERSGVTERHDLTPELVAALIELFRSRRVGIEPISRFLHLRVSALWREWPSVTPLVRAALLCAADPEVRLRGLWMVRSLFAPDLVDLTRALIGDPDPGVARDAVSAAITHRVAVHDLAGYLAHPDVEVRASIALHLLQLPAWKTLRWRRRLHATLTAALADPLLTKRTRKEILSRR